MKLSVATLLLLSVILMSTFLQFTLAVSLPPAPSPAVPSFCDPKCKIRCSEAGYYKRCYDYCMICCRDCKCVPSGTVGNKSQCPCYAAKKNTKGTSKCP